MHPQGVGVSMLAPRDALDTIVAMHPPDDTPQYPLGGPDDQPEDNPGGAQ